MARTDTAQTEHVQAVKELAEDIKRQIRGKKPKGKRLDRLLKKGRFISHHIHLYIDLVAVVYTGCDFDNDSGNPQAQNSDDNDDTESESESEVEGRKGEKSQVEKLTPEQIRTLQLAQFEQLEFIEANFPKTLKTLADKHPNEFIWFVDKLKKQAGSGRHDDTTNCKPAMLEIMYEEKGDQSNGIIKADDKSLRGWHNTGTAGHLCPLEIKDEFEKNKKKVMRDVRDQRQTVTEKAFMSFLYASGTTFDPDHLFNGLFRGFILIRILRLIFYGPSTVWGNDSTTNRDSKADKHKLAELGPSHVTYGVIQAYIALSSKGWTEVDGGVNLRNLYKNVYTLLSADSPWVRRTLKYINKEMPTPRKARAHRALPRSNSHQVVVDTILAQCEAEEERRVEKRKEKASKQSAQPRDHEALAPRKKVPAPKPHQTTSGTGKGGRKGTPADEDSEDEDQRTPPPSKPQPQDVLDRDHGIDQRTWFTFTWRRR
ncbi:hypothetical protein BKA70DRAFT_1422991 [Coprinopsis sp. MPI-PUGE-AT-0042]|nr:hypothetical protein BKA70DRAFT_1422991 [Coprinopsis sp. MPI-PUGE-AT-0042]